jgi:hypothetical protein
LTGRSEEVLAIDAALMASDLCVIVVCGAAGVGKSRVAREALSIAASNAPHSGRRPADTELAGDGRRVPAGRGPLHVRSPMRLSKIDSWPDSTEKGDHFPRSELWRTCACIHLGSCTIWHQNGHFLGADL